MEGNDKMNTLGKILIPSIIIGSIAFSFLLGGGILSSILLFIGAVCFVLANADWWYD